VPVVGEPNSQRTKYLLRVEGDVAFPGLEWGVIIGDAVHCLRSALDQLVAGLCSERPSLTTGFPICLKKRDWVVRAPGMYWSVPSAYVAVLDRAQPYHRGDAAHMQPLAILNDLWNLDKHRGIPATALVPSRVRVTITESEGVTLGEFRTCKGVALKDGAVIAESKMRFKEGITEAHVDVRADMTVSPGFGIIEKAPSISHKPVDKVFGELLIPAVKEVFQDLVAAGRSA
jgi:hypothetical protein